eukprot:4355677-Pleurochrysis_carterae.AAC.4
MPRSRTNAVLATMRDEVGRLHGQLVTKTFWTSSRYRFLAPTRTSSLLACPRSSPNPAPPTRTSSPPPRRQVLIGVARCCCGPQSQSASPVPSDFDHVPARAVHRGRGAVAAGRGLPRVEKVAQALLHLQRPQRVHPPRVS